MVEGGEKIAYEGRGFKLERWEWEGRKKKSKKRSCTKRKKARR